MTEEDLKIEGMSCEHCMMSVKKELEKLADVRVESVEIGKARVQYDESRLTRQEISRAIDEAGYQLLNP